LGGLIRALEKGWNNKSALAPLYTEDSLLLRSVEPGWVRGRSDVSAAAAGVFGRAYRVTPISYRAEASAGHVAGYLTRGQGGSARHFGYVHLSLRKGDDGQWRVAAQTLNFPGPRSSEPNTAEQLVAELDAAEVKRAVVLSMGYFFGSAHRKPPEDEYVKVRADNDWLAQQVARFPDRLVGFCSFNPLKDYALEEFNRCVKNPHLKGLKLHFGNSGVDVLNPQHVEKVRLVFRAANEKRVPMVVHLWTVGKYGREHAEAFLSQLVPVAPDVPIQVAHMAASGPGYHSDDALEVYAKAAAAGDSRMKNLYFDVASMVVRDTPAPTLELVAKRLRQLGLQRVLFASDRVPGGSNDSPGDAWEAFRLLPLSVEEFRKVAGNVAPYLR
jgi:predicted TIM-barrel fold metal-dependent hydrolase